MISFISFKFMLIHSVMAKTLAANKEMIDFYMNNKCSEQTKTLAGSVLAQANKKR